MNIKQIMEKLNEKVFTDDGIKEIGKLKIGDMILSYNFKTQKHEYKSIINIKKPVIKSWY